ncbi:SDR family NAD(P)-dependent oxidoreductase [Rubellimicrobium roseum]|uniref:SDR family oxidoreductase n=1 Tax=Rubellimicrobium roseum TaxID=687525 RepID=A0A5C4NGZ2_9RHOB|nr:SDR family oxidoreductase [Rubellimicrobium roseum]TNC74084.1 SDR family oxidoreductase [Rubellimicrobium roseum]
MPHDFSGQTAIVTGAASGIGLAIARDLAAGGARVVLSDLSEETLARVTDGHPDALIKVCDVSDAAQVEALVAFAVERTGGLHLLVNNAGIGGPSAPTGDYPLDGWHKVMGVNLHGVFYGMRYGIPAIEASGGGAIVNIASILGTVGFANAPAYVAAKHAVVGLTKNAAMEYATRGIRVNSVGPAFIRTPLLDALGEEALTAIAAAHPVKRLGTPEEVSALTCFLLSKEASFITGSYHLVDGAYTAQ